MYDEYYIKLYAKDYKGVLSSLRDAEEDARSLRWVFIVSLVLLLASITCFIISIILEIGENSWLVLVGGLAFILSIFTYFISGRSELREVKNKKRHLEELIAHYAVNLFVEEK